MTREAKQYNKTIGVGSLIAGGALCVLAGASIGSAIENYPAAGRTVPVAASADAVRSLPNFAELAKRLGPSVVNVSTTQVRRAQGKREPGADRRPTAVNPTATGLASYSGATSRVSVPV